MDAFVSDRLSLAIVIPAIVIATGALVASVSSAIARSNIRASVSSRFAQIADQTADHARCVRCQATAPSSDWTGTYVMREKQAGGRDRHATRCTVRRARTLRNRRSPRAAPGGLRASWNGRARRLLARASMKVNECMTKDVRYCNAADTCGRAAQLMWDHDIGALPVVDDDGRVVGMITDRDICMAAYTRGQPLGEIVVGDVMSTNIVTCMQHANDKELAHAMSVGQIRRVPVVDGERRLVGIVSLNDLAFAMRRGRSVPASEVAETLAAVCEPRRTTHATA